MTARKSPKTGGNAATSQVRTYLAALPPASRKVLTGLRDAIRAAAPGAEDAFSYRIPAFRLDGKVLVWYAAFKEHVSMYPVGDKVFALSGVDPAKYVTAKGTIRFPMTTPPSTAVVKRLVKARIALMQQERKK